MLTRRKLLRSTAVLSASAVLARATAALGASDVLLELHLGTDQPAASLPQNFIGLGYEMSSAACLGLLSASNAAYVQLVRNLGPSGVLRMGGIVADFTSYSADGAVVAEPKNTVVTRASLEQLRGFLDATGWTVIWSVNFGSGTLADTIVEARDVARILGARLLAIELGNEVENYGNGKKPLRPPPYTYEQYRAEYTRWRAALLEAVPGLHFAAPDTAASVEWVERMAADAKGDVQLLTTHYYRGSQSLGTMDQLMQADAKLKSKLERLGQASRTSGIPWRMCETNSFFGGGRPGVSDTLGGALWTLDYMLLLAQYGCAGVNIETGVNQLGFVSSYSPIQDDGAGHNYAGGPYYGMLAFATAAAHASTVVAVDTGRTDLNLTAYALHRGNRLQSVVLINKAFDQTVRVSLAKLPTRRYSVLDLTGPSLESKTGILLGGAGVDSSGRWVPAKSNAMQMHEVLVPPASAVILLRA